MSERILQALMQLFAIGAALDRLTLQSRDSVETFLRQQVSLQRVQEYLKVYDDFEKKYHGSDDDEKQHKKLSLSSVKMLRICTEINKELNSRQKYIVFLRLAEFMQSAEGELKEAEREFLETVASVFTIDQNEFELCVAITGPLNFEKLKSPLVLTVGSTAGKNIQLVHPDVDGEMIFLHLRRASVIFMRYTGTDPISVNGQPVDSQYVTVLSQGAVVRGSRIKPLYYSDLIKRFLSFESVEPFTFSAHNLEFVFPNGKKRIARP